MLDPTCQENLSSVFPFRCNDHLWKSCATEPTNDGECTHKTFAETALIGTWVEDEVELAVQKGYEIIEIF